MGLYDLRGGGVDVGAVGEGVIGRHGLLRHRGGVGVLGGRLRGTGLRQSGAEVAAQQGEEKGRCRSSNGVQHAAYDNEVRLQC